MKGSYQVKIWNKRISYKFVIERNITILRGDSATGKTTLIDMVDSFCKDGNDSGINLVCDKRCVVLTRGNWERDLRDYEDCIVFIDEGNDFVASKAFAEMVKNSTNYYVIATRNALFNLPYSISEIYGIKNIAANRYQQTKRVYSGLYRLYNADAYIGKPDKVIVEDSNSAYDFWRAVCDLEEIKCETAAGKSNIWQSVVDSSEDKILVIADGAAFGPEMERVISLKRRKSVVLFLPESFEWLILKSGLADGNELQDILSRPSDFIDSEKYFSWERFFTALLVDQTKDSYMSYNKSKLNDTYLHDKNRDAIMKQARESAGGNLL